MGHADEPQPGLRVLREARVRDLLGGAAGDRHRFEASGVTVRGGRLLVVCDNLTDVVDADPALTPGTARLVPGGPGPAPGYEDVAHDAASGRTFLLVEATGTEDGLRPRVDTLDGDLRVVARATVEVAVDGPNKGLEGLACVRRDGTLHLLGLAEAPDAATGRGVVHVLVEDDGESGPLWRPVARFLLPDLGFADHAGIAVDDGRVAVVSQASSALWLGRLADDAWAVAGGGLVLPFPRDEDGRTVYGTVEGVAWLDPLTLALVSDTAKPEDPHRFHRTQESVHVVALPDGVIPR